MANDNQAVGRALLQAVAGQYPAHSESLLTTEVDAAVLPGILQEINADREQVFAELRQTSRDVAPDVDGWIEQAKKLQVDIERSKITAREIVRQAEEAAELRRKHEDVNKKTKLLKAELAFNQRLETALSSIQDIFNQISDAQEALQQGQLERSLQQVKTIEGSLVELRLIENTSAVDVLNRRATQLRTDLVDEVKKQWNQSLYADRVFRSFTIQQKSGSASLEELETLSSALDILPGNIKQTCRDVEDIVFRPRLEPDRQGRFCRLTIDQDHITSSEGTSDRHAPSAIQDILEVVKFLHARLPPCIAVELSESLMPPVISRLISSWLLPAVPTRLEDLHTFQDLLDLTQNLSEELHSIGWSGSVDLKEWVEQGPRIWLSRRKESALDAVRHMLATQVTHTKTVERVETQVVAKDDAIHGPNGTGDEWDAWMEDEEDKPPLPDRPEEDKPALPARRPAAAAAPEEGDAEDFSAWGADEPDEEMVQKEPATSTNEDDEDGEAWGWDEPASSAPASPAKARKTSIVQANGVSHSNNAERQLTLKETYTVTTIPTSLHDLIERLIADASSLLTPSSEAHASSVAPAAAGIYTIPVLLLACFRALAPTYYGPLPSGLMYLYNDSLYMSTILQESHDRLVVAEKDPNNTFTHNLSQSSLPSSRLGLLEAAATLRSFGARSYGSEMDSQRTILRDMLDGAQGFANCTEAPFRDACETAISMATDRVRQVATMWQPVLSRSAWLQSLGSLISTITSKICIEVEELSDISEEESNQLRKLCEQVNKLSDLFEQDSDGQNGAGVGKDKVTLIHIYSPGWFKFQYLSEVLESSLADIKYLWNEGELKLEFEADEIVMLIEALFAETDHRRRAIAEIRRG